MAIGPDPGGIPPHCQVCPEFRINEFCCHDRHLSTFAHCPPPLLSQARWSEVANRETLRESLENQHIEVAIRLDSDAFLQSIAAVEAQIRQLEPAIPESDNSGGLTAYERLKAKAKRRLQEQYGHSCTTCTYLLRGNPNCCNALHILKDRDLHATNNSCPDWEGD